MKKRVLVYFLVLLSLDFPRLAEPQEPLRTLLLEVILTTYDVSRTETLVYLRVFSDGSAEAHPMREVDFRKLGPKSATIPPNELVTLSEFLENLQAFGERDAEKRRTAMSTKWEIYIA
jgi:hypothetical protein